MKAFYRIDGYNEVFPRLADAKHHIWLAYTQSERKKYLRDTCIYKVVKDEIVSITPIIITDDSYRFGRTTIINN